MPQSIISLGIIGWLSLYVHKPYGPIIFLALIVVLFFVVEESHRYSVWLITLIVSTQIRNQLAWWKALNSPNSLKLFAKIYNLLLTTGTISLLLGICVWLFLTPPGHLYRIDIIDYICWTLLGFWNKCSFFYLSWLAFHTMSRINKSTTPKLFARHSIGFLKKEVLSVWVQSTCQRSSQGCA